MFEEQRQSWNLLEPRSFDAYMNTTASIIVMLDYSEVDIEVLDTGMETMESNSYREASGNDGDTNGALAMM